MKGNKAIFKTNIIVSVLLGLVLTFGLVFGELSATVFSARAEETAQTEVETWNTDGWSEYEQDSISATDGGIRMQDAASEGYSFSNTSKNGYTLQELAVSMRVKDAKYETGVNGASIYLGVLPADRDLMAADGADYGVAFLPTAADTYDAWFVKRNSEATAVPGFDNIAFANNVKLSASGTLSVLFHREADNRWMIMINGNYQIDLNGQTEVNTALDAIQSAHIAVAAEDNFSGAAGQTMKIEVFQTGSDVLGTLNENGSIVNSIAGTTYEMTDKGVTFSTDEPTEIPSDLKAGVQESLSGLLDGLVISFKADLKNCASYSMDIGVGTYHEPGRYTFWDSFSDTPAVAGSIGIRFSADMNATFLLMTRTATAGYEDANVLMTASGNVKVSENDANEYTIQFLKVGDNWNVLINGRIMGSAQEGFQEHLNNTLNSLNDSPAVAAISPWLSYGDVKGKTEGYSADITVKGYGTRRWGKETDPDEGVMGDEITGDLEFSKNKWTSTCPEATTVDVKVTDEGFALQGRNEVTGFDIGMNYKEMIPDMAGYAVTFKMPEKVLASSGATHAFYGMYIGEATLKNFTEMKSVYIRWSYATENAADGANLEVIVWDNTQDNPQIASCSHAVPAKTQEGKETEVTVRFVYNEKDGAYRIYANGTRMTTPAVEKTLTSQLNAMQAKYFYCNASYETDGVGSAWSEGVDGVQEMTIVSLGGKKIVNKSPEMVANAMTLDAEALSSSSVKLTWTKAEYPVGEMDSHNFVPVGYEIERIKGDASAPEKTIKVQGDVNTLTFTDTDLSADTYYYYTVYAVDADGNRLMVSNSNKRVKTAAEGGQKPDDGDKNESKGCGSIAGATAIGASAVLLAGAVIACCKKRK